MTQRRALLAAAAATAATLAGCGMLAPPAADGGPPASRPGTPPDTPPGTPSGTSPDTPAGTPPAATAADDRLPPPPPREFRAAWVATVANIDWPSRPGLPAAAQQAEALALLDRARAIGLNAIVLQVRPAADALYASALEPWSEVLSGTQGRPPEPPYDPLAFWVEHAHRRGLQLHAWFNPYRARHGSARGALAATHIGSRRPDLVRRYGGLLWLDPGEPDAAAHTLAVVADVLRRYDVDGVHIDDYFYPYPVADQPFPDDAPWLRYLKAGGTLARDDWRRDHVDRLVLALWQTVRTTRPQALLGISPFGLGRPEWRPPGIEGFSQYHRLYADVERWLAEGWLDYLAPQLYWTIARPAQSFPVLLDYWIARNSAVRHVWPGLFTSAIGRERDPWPAAEIVEQVALQRARPGAGGHLHFSMKALLEDRDGVARLLAAGPYAEPALVPATPWLGGEVPASPRLRHDGGPRLRIEAAAGAPAFLWAVWRRADGRWRFAVQPAQDTAVSADPGREDAVAVAAVGRLGQTSAPALLRLA